MLERRDTSSAYRPFLKINGCDLCENWEWHANLHEIVRYVSRDESNRLHLVREEWTGNVRMDVTHSVSIPMSPGSRAQWDDSYRHEPRYPYIMEGPYAVHHFADDDEQAAAKLAQVFGATIIPHDELMAKVTVSE